MRQRASLPVALVLVLALAGPALAAAGSSDSPVKRSPTCATLAKGSVGAAVTTIQAQVHTTADGEFGPLTERAVKRWQRRHDVDPTGVVDAATWAALPADVAATACGQPVTGPGAALTCAHLHEGSTGPAVRVLQKAVDADVDGEFGPQTTSAVTKAQTDAKLRGSGVAGPATWVALGLAGTPACMVAQPFPDPTPAPKHESRHERAQRKIAEQVVLLAAALLDRPGTTHNPEALAALKFANHQKGKPYKWGGVGPKSYDCSGLTMTAYAHAGVTIPRVANDQYDGGKAVPLDHARAGDLMFYAGDLTDPRSIYHVVMYVGDGTVIDAPHTGAVVSTRAMWTTNLLPVAVRPSAPPTIEPDLPIRPGDTGPTVAELQRALNRHGADLTVDGGYGPATRVAVDAWKTKHGLKPNGVIGRSAWQQLV